MQTAEQAAQVFEAEAASILAAWRSQARALLPHLDTAHIAPGSAPDRAAALTLREVAAALLDGRIRPAPAPVPPSTLPECAIAWSVLSLSWPDVSALYHAFAQVALGAYTPEGESFLHPASYALAVLLSDIAGTRIAAVEQQFSEQQQEIATAQHLAGRFLFNASHELRTPLTAVLGFADLLDDEAYGPLNEKQKTAVRHIHNSAENLLEVVNNLLDVLSIRAGNLALRLRPVKIAPILHNLYEILAPLAHRKDVEFEADIAGDLGTVEADENIVRHIVYHLLSSSLRATPAGGCVRLTAERRDGALVILTHDTALHLPRDVIANMMTPFPRLENQPSRGYDNWETGLPLVRRYVEMHGGTLELESQPETGTLFRISLPFDARLPVIGASQ